MKPAPPVIRTRCNLLDRCSVSDCAGANVLIVSSTRQAGECNSGLILRRIEVPSSRRRVPEPQHACRNARCDGALGYIAIHDRAGANDRMCAYMNAGQNCGVRSHVDAESNHNRSDLQRGCDDGSILRLSGMGGAENLPSRTPPDIVFYHQCARIEVRLGTNPHMAADAASAIESSLDHDLRADEHTVAKLHRLGMLKHNVGTNLQIIADGFAKGAHQNSAHEAIEWAFSAAEAAKKLHELIAWVGIAQ